MSKQKNKSLKHSNATVAIIASKFNEFITKRLLEGCVGELSRSGLKQTNIKIVWVPGSFETPLAALKIAKKKNIDAVICLGAVIRGETYHFELVAQAASYGIQQASLMTGKPIIFGILSTNTVEQAYKRSESKGNNKGRDAAEAALDMISLLKNI